MTSFQQQCRTNLLISATNCFLAGFTLLPYVPLRLFWRSSPRFSLFTKQRIKLSTNTSSPQSTKPFSPHRLHLSFLDHSLENLATPASQVHTVALWVCECPFSSRITSNSKHPTLQWIPIFYHYRVFLKSTFRHLQKHTSAHTHHHDISTSSLPSNFLAASLIHAQYFLFFPQIHIAWLKEPWY